MIDSQQSPTPYYFHVVIFYLCHSIVHVQLFSGHHGKTFFTLVNHTVRSWYNKRYLYSNVYLFNRNISYIE